jgi:hypothetical protein
MCGAFSSRSVLRMAGCNVVCQARIPALELWPESAVECPRAHLEQQVCATDGPWRPTRVVAILAPRLRVVVWSVDRRSADSARSSRRLRMRPSFQD